MRRSSLTLASVPAASSANDGLDLALAEEPAFGVDLLGRQQMPFPAGLAQEIGRAGQERDVAGLERLVRDVPLGR